MTLHSRFGLVLGLVLGNVALGCRERASVSAAAPASSSVPARSSASAPLARAVDSATLPEDPDAGARSVAQWREHLVEEERERRLNYDRRKLPEHQRVVKLLRDARRGYDQPSAESGVRAAQAKFRASLPGLEKSFDAIDHWGASSKLLPEYRALVSAFSETYPAARIAALSGSAAAFDAAKRDVDARFHAIDEWMHEAAESEDE